MILKSSMITKTLKLVAVHSRDSKSEKVSDYDSQPNFPPFRITYQ
jgi:hypothetical protein